MCIHVRYLYTIFCIHVYLQNFHMKIQYIIVSTYMYLYIYILHILHVLYWLYIDIYRNIFQI